ncbi:MAG: Mur ligase family protein, partial [Planctomycetota bacterium]
MSLRVPVFVVEDVRRALADSACHFYENPSAEMDVIGVTGTNGKTTVTHMIRHILETDGRSAGLLGTISYEFGGRRLPAPNTTPDPVRLQGYLREMADRRIEACAMEVSSHALVQERVRGVRFGVGVFLNLTQDHLDYHGTMDAYF